MPEAVVSQIHRLARRAKAAKKLTFANSDNEDLDILYVDLERDKDNAKLEQDDVQPTGVDDDDEEDNPQDDPDYEPDYNSDNYDSYENDNNKDNVIEAECDDDETPGVDEETPGVDQTNDDNEDTESPGVDVETLGVGNTEAHEANGDETPSMEDTEAHEAEGDK